MTADDRPESWQLLVLAYVDGELDPVSQLEVEAWIRTDPEVADLVRELRATGKEGAFREAVDPAPVDLRLSGEIILARLQPQLPGRHWCWLRPAVLGVAIVGMVAALYIACPPDHVCPHAAATKVTPADPLADYGDLPIASPHEAHVSAIRGDGSPIFVSCDPPLPDVLEFATLDEVEIQKTGRSAYSVPSPDDTPMIFQLQPRAK